MNKDELVEQIISIIQKIDDARVLKDLLNIINGVYKHYINGKWER